MHTMFISFHSSSSSVQLLLCPLLLKFTASYLITVETHTQTHTKIYKYNLLRCLELLICIYLVLTLLEIGSPMGAPSLEKTGSPFLVVIAGLALLIFK